MHANIREQNMNNFNISYFTYKKFKYNIVIWNFDLTIRIYLSS